MLLDHLSKTYDLKLTLRKEVFAEKNQILSYLLVAQGRVDREIRRKSTYNHGMALFTISEVAKQVGLKPSAIRYYEQVGILPRAQRAGGQRRYDHAVLYRLALVQRAQQMGFTLEEIRRLFFGFRKATPISERWKKLSQRKLAELDTLAEQIRAMQALLRGMSEKCTCQALDQCGKGIFTHCCSDSKAAPLPRSMGRKRVKRAHGENAPSIFPGSLS